MQQWTLSTYPTQVQLTTSAVDTVDHDQTILTDMESADRLLWRSQIENGWSKLCCKWISL